MALIEADLAIIDATLAGPLGSIEARALTGELRRLLPGLFCMACDAGDVLEDAWRSYPAFDLHLVDTSDHCTTMTSDPMRANGILLARKAAA
ncbi:hypothetical protein [Sphingomonas hengshuiensis]|uniref:Uncharacterized protein n=1 Tax=Sphingomonas hengshuiensis TaxID=1609977 RepID=A0A7U4J9I4_9SPHN|nr:hypothetical protein [Sphingomonas hengshuiensis]AJP72709.1 hypothetical protein TS85_14410 [Sphingomonas hengshuiensis]